MSTILIGGYYGAGNIGDEAILIAMINELRTQKADITLIVTSWDPEKTSNDHHVESVYWKDINGLLDAALRADLIILGGGGIFHDYWGIDPDTYLRKGFWDITAFGSLPLLAKLLNIPCMIYAVGVGPFHSELAREHTRMAFERCQVATIRDNESLEFLKQIGLNINGTKGSIVKVLPDPVFSLTASSADDAQVTDFLHQRQIQDNIPLLGVSLRYWDINVSLDEWLPYIANGVRDFLEQNNQAQVILIPFQVLHATPHTNDAIVLGKLANLLNMPDRVCSITDPLTPRFAQSLIKRCTAIIGMRLHSIIMGINVGTPIIALSYAPKVFSVMKRAGLEEFCTPTLTPKAEILAGQIQKVWDQSQSFRHKIQPLQEELKSETKEHARLALDLLPDSPRGALQFSEQFAIQQVRYLTQTDEALLRLQDEKTFLQRDIEKLIQIQQTLTAQLSDREQSLQTLTTQFAESNQLIQSLSAQLADKDQSVQSLTTQLADRDQSVQYLTTQLASLSARLTEIEGSNFWKIAKSYYYLVSRTPLKYFYYFLVAWKYEGLRGAFYKLGKGIKYALFSEKKFLFAKEEKILTSREVSENVKGILNDRSLKGIVIITSAFVFNELYNQRVINLSKFLANHGWGVVYVAWRWNAQEVMPSIGKEVYKNIFQIPVDMFLENLDSFSGMHSQQKFFITEFPHPDYFLSALQLRRKGYKLVYEIIDEWEEFHKVGQASWFNKSIENAYVVNANFLTAVSQPLVEKFSSLRRDIHLSPNGYTPSLLGERHRGIAVSKRVKRGKFHLGYFGHLTESWFDWDFLIKILDLAREKNLKLYIHLIGYGEPSVQVKIKEYSKQIKFYGKIHPSKLYKYVKSWDAAFICFKTGKLSEAVDPIKIYEYLYFGLPVIVKGISHLRNFPSTHVVMDELQAFETLLTIHQTRQNKSTATSDSAIKREQMLVRSTWDQRFTDLLEILENEQWMFL